jgi:hypothetical protein
MPTFQEISHLLQAIEKLNNGQRLVIQEQNGRLIAQLERKINVETIDLSAGHGKALDVVVEDEQSKPKSKRNSVDLIAGHRGELDVVVDDEQSRPKSKCNSSVKKQTKKPAQAKAPKSAASKPVLRSSMKLGKSGTGKMEDPFDLDSSDSDATVVIDAMFSQDYYNTRYMGIGGDGEGDEL